MKEYREACDFDSSNFVDFCEVFGDEALRGTHDSKTKMTKKKEDVKYKVQHFEFLDASSSEASAIRTSNYAELLPEEGLATRTAKEQVAKDMVPVRLAVSFASAVEIYAVDSYDISRGDVLVPSLGSLVDERSDWDQSIARISWLISCRNARRVRRRAALAAGVAE